MPVCLAPSHSFEANGARRFLSNKSMQRSVSAQLMDVCRKLCRRGSRRSQLSDERFGCEGERALSQKGERGALGRVGKSQKCDRGRGRKGSLRMVWMVLAGIEDDFDNRRALIRADAGSLFLGIFFFAFWCAPCSVRTSSLPSVAVLASVPEIDCSAPIEGGFSGFC